MKRSDIVTMPEYFVRYIEQLPDIEVMQALEQFGNDFILNEKDNFIALGDKVYAPGKWTIKDILQHLIDCERVFAYRAMRIARADTTPLPGFDEDLYAATAGADDRTLNDILDEFVAVRNSTAMLFGSFNEKAMLREGLTNNTAVSVLAIGFIIAGHTLHHIKILKERYYPLLGA